MHNSNLKRTKSSESLLFFEFPKHLVSFYLLQQHVKERSRVSHLSRGNNRHTPLRGFRKKTHSHADNPTIKAVTDASIYPTKIQKIFETTKFFMPEMTRFLPGFASFFALSSSCTMSVAMPSMASRLSLDFTKNVTLSHCHIGALLRDAPTNSRHPPDTLQLPRGGRELLVQGLRRIIIGIKKIEIIEEK